MPTQLFSCEKCSKVYKHKRSLITHLNSSHSRFCDLQKAYSCGVCLKKFQTQSGMKRHCKKAHGESKGAVKSRLESYFVEEYYECQDTAEDKVYGIKCMYCKIKIFQGIKDVLEHMRECRLANIGI